jgi:quinohemoprotein ethanol dehydrogenase
MRKIGTAFGALLLAGTALVSGPMPARADAALEARIAKATDVDATRITNADKEPGNWLSHGRTYGEQRYSPLDQINASNVDKLGLAWWFDTQTTRGMHATPLVSDGIMFLTGSWSVVMALDAKTGKPLWKYNPEVPGEWGRNACCDVVNRGAALWKGKIYVGTIDGRLVALDAKTGEVKWSVNTIDKTRPYTITGAPRVVKGKVLIGNGGAELGVRGYVSAYDAETGDLAWRFYTVPGDPKKPQESPELEAALKTWDPDGAWVQAGGGGTVWDAMAYDPDLDTLYIGTGNGSPWSRWDRSPKGGDNLYLSSIVALNPDTGRMKWYYQTTPGDTWDYTATQHIILADLKIDGKTRKVLMQAPKNGFFYVLDRETGKLISADKYIPADWASHVDMKTGRPVENASSQWKDGNQAVVLPGPLGGHNWQPMSFNPTTGLVYIPAMEFAGVYKREGKFIHRGALGQWNTGVDFRIMTDVEPNLKGYLLAWDPVKRKEAWRVPMWGPWNGGTLTTAGNLVFQGTGNGSFVAYDATTGKKLWQSPAQTGIVAGPVTYTIDGEQYVSVVAGWGGAFALTFGRAAKAADVQAGGKVLTFKIGGDATLPKLDVSKLSPAGLKTEASAETIKKGGELFAANCAVCHGLAAVGGGVIPDLRYSSPAVHESWKEIVLGGILKDNGMAGFGDRLSPEQADAIQAWVIKRSGDPENEVLPAFSEAPPAAQ